MLSRLALPTPYYLDESDPDVAILRRHAGAAFVAAFTPRANKESIVETAREDYGSMLARTPEGE